MRWFGRSWGAPVNTSVPQCDTPVGELCAHCTKPIAPYDQGIVLPGLDVALIYHYRCFTEMIGLGKQPRSA